MLAAIWHASFHVADLERSVAFYRDVIGMELVHEQEQANEYTRALVGYPDATCGSRSSLCPVAGTGEAPHDLEPRSSTSVRAAPS
jgi:catechol 2,3-dioxygenase-like lactoylglutathione lyase family enzyme